MIPIRAGYKEVNVTIETRYGQMMCVTVPFDYEAENIDEAELFRIYSAAMPSAYEVFGSEEIEMVILWPDGDEINRQSGVIAQYALVPANLYQAMDEFLEHLNHFHPTPIQSEEYKAGHEALIEVVKRHRAQMTWQ